MVTISFNAQNRLFFYNSQLVSAFDLVTNDSLR